MSLCHSVYVKYTHSVSPLLVSSKGLGDEDVLYRILTNILLIFFLFSFFLFNFVPIIKEIRTINRKILRTKPIYWIDQHSFCCLTNDCYCTTSICICTFVLMWRNRDSCQPASYSLFVGRRWYFFSALIGICVFFVLFSFPYLI